MATATKTPWLVSHDDSEFPVVVGMVHDGQIQQVVCEFYGAVDLQLANAELIVAAVNAWSDANALRARFEALEKQS